MGGEEGTGNVGGQPTGSSADPDKGTNILNGGAKTDEQNNNGGTVLDAGGEGKTDGTDNGSNNQQVAPEKYESFKLEGDLTMDEKSFEGFSGVAKSLNLSQEQAQKLVDYQSTIVKENHEQEMQKSNEVVEAWKQESLEMLGENRQAKIVIANKALSQRPELKEILTQTGLINNPEVLKLVIDYGKVTSEDVLVDGKVIDTKASIPREKVLYSDMK